MNSNTQYIYNRRWKFGKTIRLSITSLIILASVISFPLYTTAQTPIVDQKHFNLINDGVDDVLNTENLDDPIRQGTLEAAQSGNLLRADINQGPIQGDDSILTTITIIRNLINYLLGFLGLIAISFLIYHGFRYVTSGEEEIASDAGNKLKQIAIAIGGIGISRFVITFIFFVIRLLVR